MRSMPAAAALTVLLAVITGCASHDLDQLSAVTVIGAVAAHLDESPEHIPSNNDPCIATDGYDDIHEGAQVIITDQDSHTVGVGELQAGTVRLAVGPDDFNLCAFRFTVAGVAQGAKFYQVHVGNQNRGQLQYTEDEIRKPVELSIG
jgi:hypothetical protein